MTNLEKKLPSVSNITSIYSKISNCTKKSYNWLNRPVMTMDQAAIGPPVDNLLWPRIYVTKEEAKKLFPDNVVTPASNEMKITFDKLVEDMKMSGECDLCGNYVVDCDCPCTPINHPKHYQGTKYEVIDIIEDFDLNFCLGNAIKYILRSGKKGDRIEDLRKAIWYLTREIG